jgi:precorrin-2 dehydrogenase / sirohydrochlorin ferrochelatase
MPVEGPQYPVLLRVAGRPCLVVGGGAVAARKVEGLVAAAAEVTVIAPDIAEAIEASGVRVERRRYRAGEAGDYRLVIAATDDPQLNGQVYADAEAAGVWVNSADDPEHCSFTLPAVLRRGPITVTASTGGSSPALASWLRDRLAQEIGPEYEILLGLLAERREALRSEGIPTEGMSWQDALDSGMLDLVRAGRVAEARERLQACLSSSSD